MDAKKYALDGQFLLQDEHMVICKYCGKQFTYPWSITKLQYTFTLLLSTDSGTMSDHRKQFPISLLNKLVGQN